MDMQQVQALLSSLVGHLITDSPQQEKESDRLQITSSPGPIPKT